jgi:putative nucleotidyltransferase with HDIG domain
VHRESIKNEVIARAEKFMVLPSLPSIVTEISNMACDENSSFSALHDLIKHDQSITAKVISIANSAYYTRGAKIATLSRAMVAMGFEEMKDMIMCMLLLQSMTSRYHMRDQDQLLLWRHCVEVAYAAKTLSEKTLIEAPEKVFTAAILHDIGRIVFFTYGNQYRKIMDEAEKTATDICTMERREFGIDHQELGSAMAGKYRFPDEFRIVIASHHGPLKGYKDLVDLVVAADSFVRNPSADIGPFGSILKKEAGRINAHMERISALLTIDAVARDM